MCVLCVCGWSPFFIFFCVWVCLLFVLFPSIYVYVFVVLEVVFVRFVVGCFFLILVCDFRRCFFVCFDVRAPSMCVSFFFPDLLLILMF